MMRVAFRLVENTKARLLSVGYDERVFQSFQNIRPAFSTYIGTASSCDSVARCKGMCSNTTWLITHLVIVRSWPSVIIGWILTLKMRCAYELPNPPTKFGLQELHRKPPDFPRINRKLKKSVGGEPYYTQLPSTMEINIGTITENVINRFSEGRDVRMKFIFERLITHIHDFARETRLSTEEWRAGLEWLEACGQICTKDRKVRNVEPYIEPCRANSLPSQELITVSDIFGLSTLVDEIDHPKPPGATQGSILGPFHSLEAENKMNGDDISSDTNGERLFVFATVKDTHGNQISGVRIHVWEADSHGEYDIEKSDRTRPDGRGVFCSNEQGEFYFKAITPVPYPILSDGPVGTFFKISGRHPYRPAHMHFMFEKEGFDKLIT